MGKLWILALTLTVGLAGCMSDTGVPYRGADGAPGAGSYDGTGEGGDPSAGAPAPAAPAGGGSGAEPGTLTAGAWDDNRNYEFFDAFREEIYTSGAPGLPPYTNQEHDVANARFTDQPGPRELLDLALVIDTTGSMADEIRYLQVELDDIAAQINTAYPSADTRWALILYRDVGDDYVTRVFDFDRVDALRARLAEQNASGGGDWPEAAHQALVDMTNLAWRESPSTARLAFWVADAPHHAERAGELAMAVRTASELDVHIYPIASSGVDRGTELSMRAAAQLTGGRYLFLTDDSGVGGSHLEPSVPCFYVTLLTDAMVRMVDVEMTGVYREPLTEQIIRTGGEPAEGACTLRSGETVEIF